MERREITAFLIGCEESDMLGYADLGDQVVAIGPDGKKYRFGYDYLAQAAKKASPPPKKSQPAKRATKSQTTTRKKTASRTKKQ